MTEQERREILSELSRVRDKLDKQEQLFNLTADDDEIEALIYEEKGLALRYSHLLRRAKELGAEKSENGKERAKNGGSFVSCGGSAADD